MKNIIAIGLLLALCTIAPAGAQTSDTVIFTLPQEIIVEPSIDSNLVNVSIVPLIEKSGQVFVNQDTTVANAFNNYIYDNGLRKRNGYRILIYSNNSQTARAGSAEITTALQGSYPNQKIYRAYSAPFFTVHIGNFRTKNDAMRLYKELLPLYPQAKIVKATIEWYSF